MYRLNLRDDDNVLEGLVNQALLNRLVNEGGFTLEKSVVAPNSNLMLIKHNGKTIGTARKVS